MSWGGDRSGRRFAKERQGDSWEGPQTIKATRSVPLRHGLIGCCHCLRFPTPLLELRFSELHKTRTVDIYRQIWVSYSTWWWRFRNTYYHVWGVWNILVNKGISLQQVTLLTLNATWRCKYVSRTWLYFFPELKRSISHVGGLPVLASLCSGSLKRMSLECHIKFSYNHMIHGHNSTSSGVWISSRSVTHWDTKTVLQLSSLELLRNVQKFV